MSRVQNRPTASRKSNLLADTPKAIYSQSAADLRPPADYVGPRKSRMQNPPDPSMNPRKNSLPILAVSKLNVQNVEISAPPCSAISLPKVCAPLRIPSNCGVHDGIKSFAKQALRLVETRKSLMRTTPARQRNEGKNKKPRRGSARDFVHFDFYDILSLETQLHGIITLGGDRNKPVEAPREPGTPPPVSGRRHFQGQTDTYVEDIADNEAEFKTTEMQCEPIFDEPLEPPPLEFEKEGFNITGTQLDQWELPDLDHAFDQPAANLAESVIMESLKQLQEEYELEALRKQHEYHKCLRNREIAILSKYKIAQAKHEEHRKYLEAHKPWDQTLDQIIKMVGFDRIRQVAPTHFLDSQTDQAIYELVHKEIEPKLQRETLEAIARTKDGRNLLDAIIEETVMRREAEYAGRMYTGDPKKKGSLATDSPSRMSFEFEYEGEFGDWQNGEYDYYLNQMGPE